MNYLTRALCTATILGACNLSWAQDLKTVSFFNPPEVLELQSMNFDSAELSYYQVQDDPLRFTRTVFIGEVLSEHSRKLMAADIDKVACDGVFDFAYDEFGTQYIEVSAIRVCLDEEGHIVAHSLKSSFKNPDDMKAAIRKVEAFQNKRRTSKNN